MVEGSLDAGGAVVFWTLADATDRDRLVAGLQPLGLDHFAPDPRPPAAVLRDALGDVLGGPRVLVRPLAARDGFAVVAEARGAAANSHATELVARVDPGSPGGVSFDPPGDGRADRVLARYRALAGLVPAAQLSAALVRVVDALGGTRLRPSGAVYWVPGHKLDDWAAAAAAVEGAAAGRPHAVYAVRHRLDADAVRAVRDAVVAEVGAEAGRVLAEVTAGDLGPKALEARRQRAAELRDKVLVYEDLLSVGLAGLHAAVDAAGQAAASAALLLAAGPAELVPAGVAE